MFKYRLYKIFLFYCLAFFCGAFSRAYAEDFSSLYSAKGEVLARTQEQVAANLPNLLQQVLVRLSLNANIMQIGNIQNTVNLHADEFLQSYSFGAENNKPILKVNFYPMVIDRLLKNNNQIVWQQRKPEILLWVVIKDENGMQLIGQNNGAIIINKFTYAAKTLAMPLLFPFLDAQDLKIVNCNIVWLPLTLMLRYASARYSYDSLVVADIDISNSKSVSARWFLLYDKLNAQWEDAGADLQSVINSGVAQIGLKLAANSLVKDNSITKSIVISVNNINSIQAYKNVTDFFSALPDVLDIKLMNISSQQAKFTILFNSYDSILQNEIANSKFFKISVAVENNNNDDYLSYDYVG